MQLFYLLMRFKQVLEGKRKKSFITQLLSIKKKYFFYEYTAQSITSSILVN